MSKMSLPKRFDRSVSPTMKGTWRVMWPEWRPFGWWWHVAYCIRVKRINHKNAEKIRAVCALIDSEMPHLRDVYVRPEPHNTSMPSVEKIESLSYTERYTHMTDDNKMTMARALKRLEVKAGLMRLEFKATGHPRKHDCDEMLSLIDVIKATMRGK
tara:strand:- start:885 stop:1352 length:468 start_codon:yes stop_codon:yes gene_type:complete